MKKTVRVEDLSKTMGREIVADIAALLSITSLIVGAFYLNYAMEWF